MATSMNLVLLFLCIGNCYCYVRFGVHNCMVNSVNNPSNLLHVHSASVTPHPIVFPGGFHVNVNAEVLQPITGSLTLEVVIRKRTVFGNIRIPCFSGVGSCTHDFCPLLASGFIHNNITVCPTPMAEDNFPCACPFSTGTYPLTDAWFGLGEMTGLWGWIAAGDYHVTGRLLDRRTNTLRGCLSMDLSLQRRRSCSNWFDCLFG